MIGSVYRISLIYKLHSFFLFFFLNCTDVWSAGCVLSELLLGQPIFPGDSGVDQLVEIIKVLGTPTKDQIREMNRNYTEFKFPQIRALPWNKVNIFFVRRVDDVSSDNKSTNFESFFFCFSYSKHTHRRMHLI